ncbi:MaoC family dehydratase [Breoghania sp. L-A4]|nr:MaoC family dehydratase [Breoghania sp. L-A4]
MAQVGKDIGVSGWIEVTQAMIDSFAKTTFDEQFIHVDPARAKADSPFGGTIAHGFLTLALLSRMAVEALPRIDGLTMSVNYGFDKVRFLSPVPSGARIRGRFRLMEAEERTSGEVTLHHQVSVEIEGADRPALAALWLTRIYFD